MARGAVSALGRGQAVRLALFTLVTTRVAIWSIAVGARVLWGRNDLNPAYFDRPEFTQPFGSAAANLVSGVLARWDAVWYLLIGANGYNGPGGLPSPDGPDQWGASVNFLPGWPLLIRLGSGFAVSRAAVIVAAYVLALIAYAVALALCYRLAEIELGRRAAVWSLVLLAVFPGALFFGTPYAESLFLALSVGSFYAARTGHWRLACCLAAAAAVTRPPGILLVVPLFFAWRAGWGGGDRARRDLAWLLLVPAAFVAFLAYTWTLTGDPLAYFHVGHTFRRTLYDPLTAAVVALKAGADGFGAIFFGTGSGPDPIPEAIIDLTRLIAFAGAAALAISAAKHLSRPYAAYAATSLILILCTGPHGHPLEGAVRYIAVIFPLFFELGRLAARMRFVGTGAAALMICGTVGLTTQFARWWFVG